MHLARFARISPGHVPTPLERLDRLNVVTDGPDIRIKRDDRTRLASGASAALFAYQHLFSKQRAAP